jgi:uncharacterized protein (TIGR02246 family)
VRLTGNSAAKIPSRGPKPKKEKHMKRSAWCLAIGGVLVALIAFLSTQDRSAGQTKPAKPGGKSSAKAAKTGGAKRADDEAAIRKATAAFIKAVEKGDPHAVAAFWTEDGEYIDDDGTTLRGRAAIEKTYAQALAKHKKLKVEITVDSIRFPSKDTAIEEGFARSYKGDPDQPTASRYSVLHVREGGRWLMALLREWPDEGLSLRDLDWLIGTWESKAGGAAVRTTYEWGVNKNSIRCRFTIKAEGLDASGMQVILKDPRSGELRAWLFDDDGGFGDSVWSRDGKRWRIEAAGVQADGGELTATNILTPVDHDTFTWQSTQRTLDGGELADVPPVRVTRVK